MKLNKILTLSFICTLLISIDLIQIIGLRFGLIPLFLLSLIILYKDRSIDSSFYYIALFSILCLPSLLNSLELIKSSMYILWIFLNYFSIFIVYRYLAKKSLTKTLCGINYAFRLQISIGFLLFILGIQERAHVLFYESSYFAIALIPYLSIYFYNIFYQFDKFKKTILLDTLLILLAVISTQSFNLMMILLIVPIIFLIISKENKIRNISIISVAICVLSFILVYYSKHNETLIATTINNIINSNDLFLTLMERTGNRWPRFELAQEIAISNFWGVGIGAYEAFTEINNYHNFNHLPKYLNPIGYPAVNIYYEIAATCGWPALLVWVIFNIKLVRNSIINKNIIILVSLLAIMIILIIESNYMRPYYWMILALASVTIKNKNK